MRKSIMKSMRNAMRKVKSVTKSVTKSLTKSLTKSKRKVTRKVTRKVLTKSKRKVKTRRAKRLRGGEYETSMVDAELELVPILADDSKDLSVSVPGFGTVGMKEYRQYMQDLDSRGSAQM